MNPCLHLGWCNLAWTCTWTPPITHWIWSSQINGHGHVSVCVHDTAVSHGQYLAFSKAWQSCCLHSYVCFNLTFITGQIDMSTESVTSIYWHWCYGLHSHDCCTNLTSLNGGEIWHCHSVGNGHVVSHKWHGLEPLPLWCPLQPFHFLLHAFLRATASTGRYCWGAY